MQQNHLESTNAIAQEAARREAARRQSVIEHIVQAHPGSPDAVLDHLHALHNQEVQRIEADRQAAISHLLDHHQAAHRLVDGLAQTGDREALAHMGLHAFLKGKLHVQHVPHDPAHQAQLAGLINAIHTHPLPEVAAHLKSLLDDEAAQEAHKIDDHIQRRMHEAGAHIGGYLDSHGDHPVSDLHAQAIDAVHRGADPHLVLERLVQLARR